MKENLVWTKTFIYLHSSMASWILLLSLTLLPQWVFAEKPDTLRTLVLLIDFSDAPGTLNIAQVKDMLNKPGYSGSGITMSSRDYWQEASRSNVVVIFDVLGYYRATETAVYYRTKTYQNGIALAIEGFNWVAKTMPNYNWNALSVSQDNRFRGLSVIPSVDIPGSGGTHYLGDRFIAPNKAKGNKLSMIGISNSLFGFNHEFGHMVFDWPDLYSITGGRGVGAWDIMAGNDEVPGIPNAVFRASQGWMSLKDISGQQTITLEENGYFAIRYRNPKDSLEYFVIEARNSSLRSTKSPDMGRGLLIWHFDEKVKDNGNYNVNGEKMTLLNHYHASLEQADGKFDLENGRNGGDITDPFLPGKTFGDATLPNSRWWDGSSSGLEISNITLVDSNKISLRISTLGTVTSLANQPNKARTERKRYSGQWIYSMPDVISERKNKLSTVEKRLHTLDGKQLIEGIKSQPKN
jgi:M6 family metalloprotease-like protein